MCFFAAPREGRVRQILAGFAPFLLWELFSLWYYGFLFPNTAYAKLTTGLPAGDLFYQGLTYFLKSGQFDPLLFIMIVAGFFAVLQIATGSTYRCWWGWRCISCMSPRSAAISWPDAFYGALSAERGTCGARAAGRVYEGCVAVRNCVSAGDRHSDAKFAHLPGYDGRRHLCRLERRD